MNIFSEDRLKLLLKKGISGSGGITILTGAGISAESGIPTFRGPQGYWSVGSRVYQPQEMATLRMFQQDPKAVWQWYLYRLGTCLSAQPNDGHRALVGLARLFPNRFSLITQNVDNLHVRAGQLSEHLFEIHGNISYVRCSLDCRIQLSPLPSGITGKSKNEQLNEIEWDKLQCQNCKALLRPHVLWFDETYNEHYFHGHSALKKARQTNLLITVGTSAQTNLPNQVVQEAYRNGAVIIDINIEENPFGELASNYENGLAISQPSAMVLPEIFNLAKKISADDARQTGRDLIVSIKPGPLN